MGDSLNQPRLKRTLIPTGKIVCQVSSSVGSDGHTLALTTDGEVYSWGDGKYIKRKNFRTDTVPTKYFLLSFIVSLSSLSDDHPSQ